MGHQPGKVVTHTYARTHTHTHTHTNTHTQEAPITIGVPSPSETARPAGFDHSACGFTPSVSTQFMGVA